MNLSPISSVRDIIRTSQLANGPSVNCETQSGEPPHAAHFTLKIAEPGGKNYEYHFCTRHMTEELANQPTVMAKVLMWTLNKQIPTMFDRPFKQG
jgi:hypothetical protein